MADAKIQLPLANNMPCINDGTTLWLVGRRDVREHEKHEAIYQYGMKFGKLSNIFYFF
jgi:hypothetical protein